MDFDKLSQLFQLSSQYQEDLKLKIKTDFWNKAFVRLTYVFTHLIKEDEILAKEILKSFLSPEKSQSDGDITKSIF